MLLFFAVVVVFSVSAGNSPKYIFLFIGDGMSIPQRMMADEFARMRGDGQLAMNTLPFHATTRTCSASSLVTDSAAAATAIACGVKTLNGKMGVDPQDRRLESVAEAAKKSGRKVGIVTSVTINHATPAGFYAHRSHRSQGYAIGLDLIDSGFDYFAGGGFGKYADDKTAPEYKGSLYELAAKAGYKVVSTKAGLMALRPGCGKVLARGCEGALPYELDGGDNATLSEFTAKGIELLDNPAGFFMMVEGGSIDWCGHSNDAAANLAEVIGLDRAVRVALAFAAKNPGETLIVVTGDHETGGMTMGFAGTGYKFYMERLANQKCSVDAFAGKLRERRGTKAGFRFEDAKKMLRESFGFEFEGEGTMVLSAEEVEQLKRGFETPPGDKGDPLAAAARIVMSGKAGVGWTSGAHTALPVLTTSIGRGAERFTGFFDNTDIAKRLKEIIWE